MGTSKCYSISKFMDYFLVLDRSLDTHGIDRCRSLTLTESADADPCQSFTLKGSADTDPCRSFTLRNRPIPPFADSSADLSSADPAGMDRRPPIHRRSAYFTLSFYYTALYYYVYCIYYVYYFIVCLLYYY